MRTTFVVMQFNDFRKYLELTEKDLRFLKEKG